MEPHWTENRPDEFLYPYYYYYVLDDEVLGTVRQAAGKDRLWEAYKGGASVGQFLAESAAKRRVEECLRQAVREAAAHAKTG